MIPKVTAPTSADMGIVSTHAQTTRRAIPHRTAETRWTAPTPTIAPVIVWVVLTGTPRCAEVKSVTAAAVSAHAPPHGLSFVRRMPIVDGDGRVIGIVSLADLALKDKPENVARTVAEVSKRQSSAPVVAA